MTTSKMTALGRFALGLCVASGLFRCSSVLAEVLEASNDVSLYGWLEMEPGLDSLPNTAVHNFVYLQKHWPGTYGTSLTSNDTTQWKNTSLTLLGQNYMRANPVTLGIWGRDVVWGMHNYLEDNSPGKTIHDGQGIMRVQRFPQSDWTVERPKPDWFENTEISFDFIYNALLDNEPVYLTAMALTANEGWSMSVTGIRWDDANNNDVLDQGEATIKVIHPFDSFDGVDAKETEYNLWEGWNATLQRTTLLTDESHQWGEGAGLYFAMTQRPVPEPSTLVLLAFAAVGLLAFVRRTRS